jgi:hypothetical protein
MVLRFGKISALQVENPLPALSMPDAEKIVTSQEPLSTDALLTMR